MKDHRLAIYNPPKSHENMYPYKGNKIWVHNKSWQELFGHIQSTLYDEYAIRFVDPDHPRADGWHRTPLYWSARKSWVEFVPSRFQAGTKKFKCIDRAIAYATKLAKETGEPVQIEEVYQ